MWCEFSNKNISLAAACLIVSGAAVSSTVIAARQRNYTPREFRSVLYGLGYNVRVSEAPLTDAQTRKAIREFQRGYKIGVDGVAGPNTQNLAAEIVKNLKYNLNLVANPDPKLTINQFYGPRTQEVVKKYQQQLEIEQSGIADLALRQRLNQQAKDNPEQPTPTATPESSPSPTATPEVTPTPVIPEPTPTPTQTPEVTPTTPGSSPSPTATPEVTPTPVIPEPTPTPTESPEVTPTIPGSSPSPTATPEVTPTPVIPEPTPTPTESPEDEEEATPTPTPTESP